MLDLKEVAHKVKYKYYQFKIEFHHRRYDLDRNPFVVSGKTPNQTLFSLRTPFHPSQVFYNDTTSELYNAIELMPDLAATSTVNANRFEGIEPIENQEQTSCQQEEDSILEQSAIIECACHCHIAFDEGRNNISCTSHHERETDEPPRRIRKPSTWSQATSTEDLEHSGQKSSHHMFAFFPFHSRKKKSQKVDANKSNNPQNTNASNDYEGLQIQKSRSKLSNIEDGNELPHANPQKYISGQTGSDNSAKRSSSVFTSASYFHKQKQIIKNSKTENRKSSWQVVNNAVSLNAALLSTGNATSKLSGANADFTNCKTSSANKVGLSSHNNTTDSSVDSPLRKKNVRVISSSASVIHSPTSNVSSPHYQSSVSPVYEDIYDIVPTSPLVVKDMIANDMEYPLIPERFKSDFDCTPQEQQQIKDKLEKAIEAEIAAEIALSGKPISRAYRDPEEKLNISSLIWELKCIKIIRKERLEKQSKMEKVEGESDVLHQAQESSSKITFQEEEQHSKDFMVKRTSASYRVDETSGYADFFANYMDDTIAWKVDNDTHRQQEEDDDEDGTILKEASESQRNININKESPSLTKINFDVGQDIYQEQHRPQHTMKSQLGFSPVMKAPATSSIRAPNVTSESNF